MTKPSEWEIPIYVEDYNEMGPGWVTSLGCFDSYISALAANMGLWEEYCEYWRLK